MKYWIILFFIFTTNVYAHGSSHYKCESERVGYDKIEHCTSYDKPQPDKFYPGYYTEEKIQERQDHQQFMMWLLLIGFIGFWGLIVLLLISMSSGEDIE
jgi:hypothetical protein